MNDDKLSKKLYSHKYNYFILSKSYENLTKIYFVHPNNLETIVKYLANPELFECFIVNSREKIIETKLKQRKRKAKL